MTTIRLAIPDFGLRGGCDLLSGRSPAKADEDEPTAGAVVLSLVESEFFIVC
jgi:hypothetical protein